MRYDFSPRAKVLRRLVKFHSSQKFGRGSRRSPALPVSLVARLTRPSTHTVSFSNVPLTFEMPIICMGVEALRSYRSNASFDGASALTRATTSRTVRTDARARACLECGVPSGRALPGWAISRRGPPLSDITRRDQTEKKKGSGRSGSPMLDHAQQTRVTCRPTTLNTTT